MAASASGNLGTGTLPFCVTHDIALRMTATYQLSKRERLLTGRMGTSIWRPAQGDGYRRVSDLNPSVEVPHAKTNGADSGAAFGSFTFPLVSCDRHDFLRGLPLLHGP